MKIAESLDTAYIYIYIYIYVCSLLYNKRLHFISKNKNRELEKNQFFEI
jgi:hypothetical protein